MRIKFLDKIPTADVVEVKHGEWIEDSLVDGAVSCSLCAYTDYRFNYDKDEWGSNYCPNCGAKMDGKNVLKERETNEKVL